MLVNKNEKCRCIAPHSIKSNIILDSKLIPKFVTELPIPKTMQHHKNNYKISTRQTTQQMLPNGFPCTTIFAYGSGDDMSNYTFPSATIEAKYNEPISVTWVNELVDENNNYLPHLFAIDQTLHWANPAGGVIGRDSTMNKSPEPYTGPIPNIVHAHGLKSYDFADGYSEAWYLPNAKNIPDSYAKVGSKYEYMESKYLKNNSHNHEWKAGSLTSYYTNIDSNGTAWYHDHSMGITRLNVYAGLAGAYIIRGNPNTVIMDCRTNLPAVLPSNKKYSRIREMSIDQLLAESEETMCQKDSMMTYREIPLIICDKSFNTDGSMFYPSNRSFAENLTPEQFNIATIPQWFDPNDSNVMPFVPGNSSTMTMPMPTDGSMPMTMPMTMPMPTDGSMPMPTPTDGSMTTNSTFVASDVHPITVPEFFGNSIVVNGVTWPYMMVDRLRYRFRILNASNARSYILHFGTNMYNFWVIGTDTSVIANKPAYVNKLVVMPGERYDIIFDFSTCVESELLLINFGPEIPLNGTTDVASDPQTTGMVMKFVISNQKGKYNDETTPCEFMVMPPGNNIIPSNILRTTENLSIAEYDSSTVQVLADANGNFVQSPNGNLDQYFNNMPVPPGTMPVPYGPISAFLGTFNSTTQTVTSYGWMDPITETPLVNSPIIYKIYNTTVDCHPVHIHFVQFKCLGREPINPNVPLIVGSAPQPWESGKDTIISYPGEILILEMMFTITGLYVWHCHMIEHEDNELMRPLYVKSTIDEIINTSFVYKNMCDCGDGCNCGDNCKCTSTNKCGATCKCGNYQSKTLTTDATKLKKCCH